MKTTKKQVEKLTKTASDILEATESFIRMKLAKMQLKHFLNMMDTIIKSLNILRWCKSCFDRLYFDWTFHESSKE